MNSAFKFSGLRPEGSGNRELHPSRRTEACAKDAWLCTRSLFGLQEYWLDGQPLTGGAEDLSGQSATNVYDL